MEIKPWVKPHLRARLIAEAKEKEPRVVQGLTPPVPQSPVQMSAIVPGMRVMVQRPVNNEAPFWRDDMDAIAGKALLVTRRPHGWQPHIFEATDGSNGWMFHDSWVICII